MKAVKGVRFAYRPTPQTANLLSTFRDMVNDAIRICLAENIKGRLRLRDRIYKEFQERFGLVSCFPYSVAQVAWSIVKKHKHCQRRPYAKRLMFRWIPQTSRSTTRSFLFHSKEGSESSSPYNLENTRDRS